MLRTIAPALALLLVADGVDREESLTDGQRDIVKRMMDGAVSEVGKMIEEKFASYHADKQSTSDAVPVSEGDRGFPSDDGNILAAEDDEAESA